MTDLLGPASATNAVTTRKTDGRSFPTGDTWFKPCTTASAQDGTQIQADFLNGLLAQLRAAIRGNGKLADGVTPVIAENNASDAMLLGAIQALIQRGQTTFGLDTGTTDALVIAPSPAVTEYKAGMRFFVQKNPLVGANITTAPTIAVSGLAALTITKADASALGIGDLKKAVGFEFEADGAGNARLVSMMLASDIGTYIAANFIISTAITIQIGGTAPAASTSGYPNYFATLQLAQNWLSQYRIWSLGSVLLQFPGGSTGNNKIAINTSLSFTHPDGVRITISGGAPTGTTPNSASLQMTGNSAAQRASDNAANLATCRSWLATELFLTNGSTLYFGSQINVQNILFNCDGSKNAAGNTVDLVDFTGGGLSVMTNCAFFNASHYGFAVTGGALLFTYGTIVASGCAAPNIVAVGNGTLSPQGPIFSYSSGVAGVMALGGGEFYSTPGGVAPCYAKGNATSGFYADLGTIDLGDGSVPSYADYNSYGYYAYEGSRIYAALCEASNNSNAGWYAVNGSYIEASNTSGSGNGNGFYAANQSGINRTGTSATGSTQASPAVGSVGNGNSYIS